MKRHSAVPAEAASVGDELCCSAVVFLVEVRAHHPTPPSTALVEGGGADRLQAGSLCLQVSARCSTDVPRRRTLPASRHRSSMSSAFCLGIVSIEKHFRRGVVDNVVSFSPMLHPIDSVVELNRTTQKYQLSLGGETSKVRKWNVLLPSLYYKPSSHRTRLIIEPC